MAEQCEMRSAGCRSQRVRHWMGRVGIWEFYETLGDLPRGELTPLRQGLAAICDLRQEVNSGGLDSYFRYLGGDTALVALEALPTVLGEEWGTVLREAMSLFGPVYPTRQGDRESMLDELDVDDALEELDSRFFELEGSMNADTAMDSHLLP